MKFMAMHKVDARMEAGERPPQTLIQEMGRFIGTHLKSGVFLDGAGLHPSATRARVTFEDGRPSVEHGPFAGRNELLAAFALISTTGIDRALELAHELARATGDRDVEVGPVVEGWDLTDRPRPADAPYRFLLLVKADAALEAGESLPAPVDELLASWKRAGLLQTEARLAPSKGAARTKVVGGKRQWIDGPFTESKELIAGFSILELPSMADAKRLTEQYVAILGDNECDVRELA